jgi:exopolysaccharide biosynthesis polyprenyl glycosylphosphotransferase
MSIEALEMRKKRQHRAWGQADCRSARSYFVECSRVYSVYHSISSLQAPPKKDPAPSVACPVCNDTERDSGLMLFREALKRIFDLVVSLVSLVLLAPVMMLVAAAIRLSSPGAIIYRQERVGKDARVFTMYKFRTMSVDAEDRSGPVWARKEDPRVTPLGRFLRKTHLDELPQLCNVLIGDMSIVGPRPERPYFVARLHTQIPEYHKRLLVKPGITGLAQVRHSYDSTLADVKKKIRYDLKYIKKQSLVLDLKVMVWTLGVMGSGKGAH